MSRWIPRRRRETLASSPDGRSNTVIEVASSDRSSRRPRLWVGLRLDRISGLMDGLRGMPTSSHAARTARLQRISHWSMAQGNRLMSFYGPQVADLDSMREQLVARRVSQVNLLEDSRVKVDLIMRDGPRSGRRFGEAALTDDLVSQRRVSEFERTVAEAIRQARIHESETVSLDAAISACEHRLVALEEQRDCDLGRLAARAGGRRAAYFAGVTATHPDRAVLVASFDAQLAIESRREHSESIHLVKAEETA